MKGTKFKKEARLFQKLFNTEEGQKVLASIYEMCGVSSLPVNPSPHEMHKYYGKMQIASEIAKRMGQDMTKSVVVVDEHRRYKILEEEHERRTN